MAQSMISFFVSPLAVSEMVFNRFPNINSGTGQAKPSPIFNSGMFAGASNTPGIGISTEQTNLAESEPSWTLLDQAGNTRDPQIGQLLGGSGIGSGSPGTLPANTYIRLYAASSLPTAAEKKADGTKDGFIVIDGTTDPDAALVSLAAGWAEAIE